MTLLLDNGAPINAMDNKQTTPFCAAALMGNERIVKLLLDGGGRINPPKNVGRSTLNVVVERG